MSREIKFRFWDTVEKKWMTDGREETGIYDFAFKQNMNWRFLTKEQAEVRVVVEQYTGLKDKNGNPIYEGDRIRITAAIDMFNDDGSISMRKDEVYEDAIVSFSNGAFWLGYGCIPEKHLLKMILNDGNWRGEIVGNIHQPELMEQGNG